MHAAAFLYMQQQHQIRIHNQSFVPLPQKALWWPKQQALLLSDLHIGKAVHFSKHGINLPNVGSEKDLDLLAQLITWFNAQKVYLLGDLFHGSINKEWQYIVNLIAHFKHVAFGLIQGNHDVLSDLVLKEAGIAAYHYLEIDGILLTHKPIDKLNHFNICGHIHPGIILKGKGRQTLKLPCFYKTPNQLILPAFGRFTGLDIIKPNATDSIYAIANNQVVFFEPTCK